MSNTAFIPKWASPPGATIRQVLDERKISLDEFASMMDLSIERVEQLIRGEDRISIGLARRLSGVLGASVEFWIARDGQYCDDVERLEADQWVGTLPLADMKSFGWVEPGRAWHERIDSCLSFFGVRDFQSWKERYTGDAVRARYRLSTASEANISAITAWLRRAEIEASASQSAPWDREKLRRVLPELKKLVRIARPEEFLPKLIALCAEAGVLVTVLRAPRGCPASGAARLLDAGRAQIILSGRYLSDDHFWFTFFHEVAHLLNDDLSETFVDELDRAHSDVETDEEKRADDFASTFLVPSEVRKQFPRSRPHPMDVRVLARRAGVTEGVIVGQLQHAGVLGYSTRLNSLKRRYRWSGSSLERA